MLWGKTIFLEQGNCLIEPLTHKHCQDLINATKDGELWKLPFALVPSPEEIEKDISRRLAMKDKDSMFPFAVIDKQKNKAIGMTA